MLHDVAKMGLMFIWWSLNSVPLSLELIQTQNCRLIKSPSKTFKMRVS